MKDAQIMDEMISKILHMILRFTQTPLKALFKTNCIPLLHIGEAKQLLTSKTFYVREDSTDSFKGGETGRNQYCSDRHHGEVTKFKTCVRDQYFKQMSIVKESGGNYCTDLMKKIFYINFKKSNWHIFQNMEDLSEALLPGRG